MIIRKPIIENSEPKAWQPNPSIQESDLKLEDPTPNKQNQILKFEYFEIIPVVSYIKILQKIMIPHHGSQTFPYFLQILRFILSMIYTCKYIQLIYARVQEGIRMFSQKK